MKLFKNPTRILFVPVALAMACDFLFTFVGQPAGFWTNTGMIADEMSPIGIWLLNYHNPIIFAGLSIVYALLVYVLFIYARPPFNYMVALGFLLGHVTGAGSWIIYDPKIVFSRLGVPFDLSGYGWWNGTIFVIIFGIIGGLCIQAYAKRAE